MSSGLGVQLLEDDFFEPAIAHEQHAPCPREQRGSVSNDDAGDGKRGDEIGDALFCVGIDIGGSFIEHEDFGFAVKCARQQNALLLSAGEYRTHVADEREIRKRQFFHVGCGGLTAARQYGAAPG